jgi:hypothetical protein
MRDFLGRRTLKSFRDFGILPAFAGVVVSGRYVSYFHDGWEHIAGNQACCSHRAERGPLHVSVTGVQVRAGLG